MADRVAPASDRLGPVGRIAPASTDRGAGYLHIGFIVISLPNLALIAAMVALF